MEVRRMMFKPILMQMILLNVCHPNEQAETHWLKYSTQMQMHCNTLSLHYQPLSTIAQRCFRLNGNPSWKKIPVSSS